MKTFAFPIVCIAHPLLILFKTNPMASQSQQWKDIPISKEDAQKDRESRWHPSQRHRQDIDNARLIVSFRELTYQWWFVTGSLSGWCLLYSSLDFRPCTRLGFTFVGNQRVSFVLQTHDLVKNLTRNRSENDVYSFFLFKKKLQFRCCLARLVSHIHYRAASRTDVPDCERPPLIDFDWLSGLDNGIWKGRQCGTLP